MRAVTIVVRVEDGAQGLRYLVAGLDAQTAATDDFDVVWAVGPDGVVPDRVEAWLGLRPHHRLVRGGVADALAAGEGAYALVVTPTDRLYPDAVERLLTFADEHGLDAVLARTSIAGAAVSPILLRTAVGLSELPSTDDAFPAPVLMVRRESATIGAEGQLVAPAGRTYGVLSTAAVLRRAGTVAAGAPLPTRRAGWQGTELVLEVEPDGLGTPLVGLLQRRDNAQTYLLPVELSDGADPVATVRFAPLDLPEVHAPLELGAWQLLVQGATPTGETQVRALAWHACPPALIGTTGFVPFAVDGTWALDVGPMLHPLVVVENPDDGVVHETPYGSRMVVSLTGLHTAQAEDLDGFVSLAALTMPARVVSDGAGARLEAMVTGVRGIKPISIQFGPGGSRALGVSLEISDVGAMTLVRTPEPPPPAKPAPAPSTTAAPKGERQPGNKKALPAPRRGVLAAVRRRVPAPLEPAVHAVSGWKPARRLYRRLTH